MQERYFGGEQGLWRIANELWATPVSFNGGHCWESATDVRGACQRLGALGDETAA